MGKGYLLHGFLRHCRQEDPGDATPFRVTPIDHIPQFEYNRFDKLKKIETYCM